MSNIKRSASLIKAFKFNFSKHIQALRISANLSVEELSQQSGIPIYSLYEMELGNYKDWGVIFKLARFYNKNIKLEIF